MSKKLCYYKIGVRKHCTDSTGSILLQVRC